MILFAFVGLVEAIPLVVCAAIVAGIFGVLNMISNRNSKAVSRLERISRPASLADMEEPKAGKKERFGGMVEAAKAMSAPLMPQTELEQSQLKIELANAGFRSESAVSVYLGIRFASILVTLLGSCGIFLPKYGMTWDALQPIVIITGLGFYLPQVALWYLRTSRQQAIFLALPDVLDLLVVCVESGLGLDAGMRKVCEEMSHHKAISEELTLANFQLQMGRPRREVLHDLGVRTGVDDLRALAAILIQADRFGSSIAQALRVQSDSMRTRRKQIAEEKAAKTAVQLIFPLVLFIFPGIFVVLVGPAAINIINIMMKK
ncbi:MAG: type II secretion system F family protein [Gemmataceae bacterium]